MRRALALVMVALPLFAATQPLPWLGMSFTRHTDSSRRVFLLVERVAPGGPAEQASIRPGDLITRFNQTAVGFSDDLDLLLYLAERKPGERLACDFVRNGRAMKTVIVLGKLPDAKRPAWEQSIARAQQRRAAARATR
ncbi:MAG TPA: PDZ domain-containing protein [Thermoanaerobaculia bacterium]|jgi:S1-C subfamily serine protease|nr:PDZ domain-containing protein [Thermoanaerobaculia bacterium]